MRLPEIILDDRGFQDLVTEARKRVARSCPEWTDHNVSDPGITLIEQFAWMTDLTLYRLGRVPDKLHIALMELLGIRLDPAVAATTGLRFRTVVGARAAVDIPAYTEVGTRRSPEEEAIIFQTDEAFTIKPLRPVAYALSRGDGSARSIGVVDGEARPAGSDQLAFGSPPAHGDALCLGFDEPLDRLVLRIDVKGSEARGAGINPQQPPLRWEVYVGDDSGQGWAAAEVLLDQTGGFNYKQGAVELQLPATSEKRVLGDGPARYWVRCRYHHPSAEDGGAPFLDEGVYKHPPEIFSITARPVGALVPATHSVVVRSESIGVSDGTPGQEFPLLARPVLPLRAGEVVEVLEPGIGKQWEPWEAKESLAGSTEDDRHFVLDLVSGTIELGPAIREREGNWTQHGAIPPAGSRLRITQYRHGGGISGNVAAGVLTMLKSSLPGIDRVTNPDAADDGLDAESLAAARQRAGLETRTRHRAVTAADYEFLAVEVDGIARAVCVEPAAGGPVTVRVLRSLTNADRHLPVAKLQPDAATLAKVAAFLDERRTIGTQVVVEPMRVRGVVAVVDVRATPTADLDRVREDVEHALYTYLNPLVGGSPDGPGSGWPFGRRLNPGEVVGIVQRVPGVESISDARIYETDLAAETQKAAQIEGVLRIAPDEVIASGKHSVNVKRSSL